MKKRTREAKLREARKAAIVVCHAQGVTPPCDWVYVLVGVNGNPIITFTMKKTARRQMRLRKLGGGERIDERVVRYRWTPEVKK